MNSFVSINNSNVTILDQFISNLGEARTSFRYFNTRDLSVLKNHLITYIYLINNIPAAYGHLDREDENVWLGICVLPDFQGQGISKLMMIKLIDDAKTNGVKEVLLTVDKDNIRARNLYGKMGFVEIDIHNNQSSISKYVFKI